MSRLEAADRMPHHRRDTSQVAPVDAPAAAAPIMPEKEGRDFTSGVVNGALIVLVLFFVLGSLWVDVFAIPAFFVFFRASVVTIATVRQARDGYERVLLPTCNYRFFGVQEGCAYCCSVLVACAYFCANSTAAGAQVPDGIYCMSREDLNCSPSTVHK